MADVTQILAKIESGDPNASAELLPLVYEELRLLASARMASERSNHTLQATALVHEAYLRLIGGTDGNTWDSRGHFFSAAAEAMRRILIDSARAKSSQKRSGHRRQIDLDNLAYNQPDAVPTMLDINEGLERLANEDAKAAEVVKLRLFAGLSVPQVAQALGMSRTKAYENWEFARAWFAVYLETPD